MDQQLKTKISYEGILLKVGKAVDRIFLLMGRKQVIQGMYNQSSTNYVNKYLALRKSIQCLRKG